MRRVGKHVHRFGGGRCIAALVQQLQIPCQGSRVAGNIDDALRLHGHDGVDCLRVHALARRIDHNAVRLQAARGELRCRCASIRAQKLRILNAVARCVFRRVLHRLRHDLRTDDVRRSLCQTQADRARAAV